VSVVDEDKVLGEIIYNLNKQHSAILIPMIDRLLSSLDIDIKDVDGIACASGPGSFTGLRIGAATAKGLCHGAGKPLVGIPTLDGLAYNMSCARGIICPIIDALRNNVYTALYRWEEGAVRKLEGYMALSIDELTEKIKSYGDDAVFHGDGVFVHKEKIREELNGRALFAPPNLIMQRASSIACLALKRLEAGDTDNYLDFTPFYLRKSQAEREYEKAHGGTC
jgi:tRNA threonylcarbamoyladenosine biosynthesis protein TsaB